MLEKIKPLTKEQLNIIIDRLTRFKETEAKYLRVFKEVIAGNLLEPKFKKSELDAMDYGELRDLAQDVINFGLEGVNEDFEINKKLACTENAMFNLSENVQKLLDNKINYRALVPGLKIKPVSRLVLAEGITEEILLPEFARICGYEFGENNVHIISAGGKNQVVKYFYQYADSLKIPMFVLFDSDAAQNLEEIRPKLRGFDRVYVLKSGEFEDLLPLPLIKRTLNSLLKNFYNVKDADLRGGLPMAKILEQFFKLHGLSEFKKADFAQAVRDNIQSDKDVFCEIAQIISGIKNC
ncbi:MAG: hypothetical protein LBJ74_00900 [Heliobacteriaceae bacterium]|jgi:hypothetical protein|nr:hypothetical protein [Heliobacteriaceae bacterium]